MKNTKICPKCQNVDIVRIARPNNSIIPGFGGVILSKYICLNCGYLEEWIEVKEDLEKIKKKFKEIK